MGFFNSKFQKLSQNNYIQIVCVTLTIIFLSSFGVKSATLLEFVTKEEVAFNNLSKDNTTSLTAVTKNKPTTKNLANKNNATTVVCGGKLPSDDYDCDGIANNVDLDDDNDGILDTDECVSFSHPSGNNSYSWMQRTGGDATGIKSSGQLTNFNWSYSPGGVTSTGTVSIVRTGAGSHTVSSQNYSATISGAGFTASTFTNSTTLTGYGNVGGIYHFASDGAKPNDQTGGQNSTTIYDFKYAAGTAAPQNTKLLLFDPGATSSGVTGPFTYVFNPTLNGQPVDMSSWAVTIEDPYTPSGSPTGAMLPSGLTWNANLGLVRLASFPIYGTNFPDAVVIINTGTTIFDELNIVAVGLNNDTLAIGVGADSPAGTLATTLSCDTDNDGVPNHLDLDSDGDGCPDAIEGDGTFLLSNLVTDNSLDAGNTTVSFTGVSGVSGVQQNLGTTVDTSSSSATYGVPVVSPNASAVKQAIGTSLNKTENNCLDTDSDGVQDSIDLDDDNDGILDADELCDEIYDCLDNNFIGGDRSSIVSNPSTTIPLQSGAIANLFDGSTASANRAIFTNNSNITNKVVYSFDLSCSILLTRIRHDHVGGTPTSTFLTSNSQVVLQGWDAATNAWVNISDIHTATGATINPSGGGEFIIVTSLLLTNKYRLYGLSGRVTNTAIEEIYLDYSTDYNLYASYSTCDTDNDGILNHLDLDSDGDGCADALEGDGSFLLSDLVSSTISGGNTSNGGAFTGLAGASPVNQNLGNTVDTTSGSATLGVPIVSTATAAVAQGVGISADKDIESCTDTDGDGITDYNDLDDDNDGILDTDESNNLATPIGVCGDFDEFSEQGWSTLTPTSGTNCLEWSAIQPPSVSTTFEIVAGTDGFGGSSTYQMDVLSPQGGNYVGIASNGSGSETFGVQTTNLEVGATYQVEFYWANSGRHSTERDNAFPQVYLPDGTYLDGNNGVAVAYNNNVWYHEVLTFTANQASGPLGFRIAGTGAKGLSFDGISVSKVGNSVLDTDNDGIPNHLDLDSDGDGCPDALEGDGAFLLSDLVTDTNIDGGNTSNGGAFTGISGVSGVQTNLGTTVDTVFGSATYGVPIVGTATAAVAQGVGISADKDIESCTDTDGDGVTDYNDLDDDNDGILDTDECSASPDLSNDILAALGGTGITYDSADWANAKAIAEASNSSILEDFESFSGSTNLETTPLAFGTMSIASANPYINSVLASSYFGTTPVSGTKVAGIRVENSDPSVVVTLNLKHNTNGFAIRIGDVHDANSATSFLIEFGNETIWETLNTFVGANASGNVTNTVDSQTFSAGNGVNNFIGYYNPSVSFNQVRITQSGGGADNFTLDDISFFTTNPTCDTDNDGIPNQLDLDSDGDGCPDALEGDGAFLVSNLVTDTNIDAGNTSNGGAFTGLAGASPVNQNLGNTVDTTSGSATLGVPIVGTATAAVAQGIGISADKTIESCTDTDGDDIPDYLDIDDDNDGILDVLECTGAARSFYCGGFESNSEQTWAVLTDATCGTTYIKHENSSTQTFELVVGNYFSTFNGINSMYYTTQPSPAGGNYVGIATTEAFAIKTEPFIVGATYRVKYYWANTGRHSTERANSYAYVILPDGSLVNGNNGVQVPFSSSNTVWYEEEFEFVATAAYTGRLGFSLSSAGFGGVAIDAVELELVFSSCDVDTDNDGIPNSLDLDSDGDGCPDAVEAGISQTLLTTGTVENGSAGAVTSSSSVNNALVSGDTDANNNGLLDSVENGTTGEINYTSTYTDYAIASALNVCADTDGDGVGDLVDLDDDNDGILDEDETDPSISCNTDCTWFPTNRGRDNMLAITANGTPTSLTTKYGFDIGYPTPANSIIASSGDVRLGEGLTGGLLGNSSFTFITVDDSHLDPFRDNHYFELDFTTKNFTGTYALQEIAGGTAKVPFSVLISENAFETSYTTLGCEMSISGNTLFNVTAIPLLPNKTYTIRIYFHGQNTSSSTDFGDDFFFSGQRNYSQSTGYSCTPTPVSLGDRDTDNDGIPNRLDLDSDGDGCADALEGDGAFLVSNLVTDTNIDGGNTSNGGAFTGLSGVSGVQTNLGKTVDTDPTSATYGVPIVSPATTAITQGVGISTNKDIEICTDTDGDGVLDYLDLDDDNDGILDASECKVVNYTPAFVSTNAVYNSSNNPNSTVNGIINRLNGAGSDGISYNSSSVTQPTFVYTITLPNVRLGTFELYATVGSNNAEQLKAYALTIKDASNAIVFSGSAASASNFSNETPLTVAINENFAAGTYTIEFQDKDTAYSNREFSEIRFVNNLVCDIDTDNDGIPNLLDLDSDGDGCPDAIEGDGAFSQTDLVTSTMDGGNTSNGGAFTGVTGVSPVQENLGTDVDETPGSATYGVPIVSPATTAITQGVGISANKNIEICTDTDGDGVADYYDIDDDNDGILDVIECNMPTSYELLPQDFSFASNVTNGSQNGTEDISSKWNLPSGSIIVTVTGHNTNVYGNSVVGTGRSTNYKFSGTVPVTIQITHGDTIRSNDKDGFIDINSVGFTFTGTLNNPNLTQNITGNSYSILNSFSSAITNGSPLQWESNDYVSDITIFSTSNTIDAVYNIQVRPQDFINCRDTDNDGIPNYLDLDSDGDGCPDAVEAGIPTALTAGSVTNGNGTDATANTTSTVSEAVIDVTADPVGANGFANSLESGATDSGTVANAYTTTNYTTYGTDSTKNGCGIPMITQVYQSTGQRWIEITNINSNIIVPNAATLGLYKDLTGNQDDVAPTAFLTNNTEVPGGKTILVASSNVANKAITAIEIVNSSVTDFNGENDQLIISRGNGVKSYNGRVDIIKDIEDKTSYVRIDEVLTGNATYTSSEWVAYVDDAITTYTNVIDAAIERHVHAPLISEISSANDQANIKPGLHRVLLTEKTASGWSNGFPDRSRHVRVGIDYNHTSTALNARKLTVHNGSILSITNQALVVSDAIDISTASDQIRLVSSDDNNQAQLIQTHEGVGNITGAGRLLVDQNSETASVYRFNYFSSPVNSIGATTFTVADVLKDGTTELDASSTVGTQVAKEIDFVAGYDGEDTDPIKIANYWLFTQAAGGNWSQKGSTGVIAQTDGFIMKGTGVAQNYTFSGSPKDGTLSTSIGAEEFYLVGNPYASSLSVQKFLQDNLTTLTATAYFWQHAGEDVAFGTQGHNYAGYIGGYATRNLSMGLAADNRGVGNAAFDVNLEAEDATFTGSSQTINGATVVELNTTNSSVEFANLPYGVDVLTLQYQSANNKMIKVHVNGVFKQDIELTASTAQPFGLYNINLCLEAGSTVTLISNDSNTAYIDLLRLYDADGDISCSPSLGTGVTYKVPGPFVPIGQGFFIEGDAGGAVEFNNSQRSLVTEGTTASVFFRGQAKTTTANTNTENSTLPLIKLGMDYLNANNTTLHRQLGVSFKATNTFAFDKGYDSEIFDINPTDVYWKFDNNNSKYVIAGVQGISDDLEIPLEIVIAKDQSTVVFGIDEIQQISNDVYILDKLTGHTHQITHNSAAIVLDAGVYSDRFAVTFKAQAALSTTQTEAVNNSLQVYYNTIDAIELVNKDNLSIQKVSLYSLVGQEVKKWKVTENNTQTNSSYKVSNLASGIYFVKVYTKDKQTISKKLLID
ncbi:T9SS type A sorting domain-containing protein [uncultured Polaribacter sp.]|uniref:T9SS type A sorting domain-containing protein n=1 Tax=uncultured Polaribacter sp. TaxID=174711 RepID=UPI002617ACCF|nr:T9SS type A sorting domain-containing protein [uncultured Polaribacter sp.]